jgi:hypothetical protein
MILEKNMNKSPEELDDSYNTFKCRHSVYISKESDTKYKTTIKAMLITPEGKFNIQASGRGDSLSTSHQVAWETAENKIRELEDEKRNDVQRIPKDGT